MLCSLISCTCLIGLTVPAAQADPHALAEVFGQLPSMYNARLSPDGELIVFLSHTEHDLPIAFVTDVQDNNRPVVASKPGMFDVYWCDWANNERLLCGFVGITGMMSGKVGETRLVAVDTDGGNQRVLLQDRLAKRREFAQFQDDIVDWLPDEPDYVLMEMPETEGTGVARVNISNGKLRMEERVRDGAREWMSDGHGQVRLRYLMTTDRIEWQHRAPGGSSWATLYRASPGDDVDFYPLGFGDDRNQLLVLRPHADRLALWSQPLNGEGAAEIVFSHPAVDAGGLLHIGKYRRLAGISYVTDSPRMHYFDAQAEKVVRMVSEAKPGNIVNLVDESWDRKVYLLQIRGANDAGRYYRLDLAANQLEAFWPVYPALEGRELAQMNVHPYAARDGVSIPAYLTLPPGSDGRNLPLVLLPHGGPESRDYLGFDFLGQFLAARGYAVLQANYRGSGGYGSAWSGEGGFREWRKAVSDLADGTRYLVDEGIADPARICAVGWSYGGYAALLSALEHPDLFQCVVSIAGVTDPLTLIQDSKRFLNKKWVREFVSSDERVISEGSPLRRASEIAVPVMLFHGDHDLNVNVKHSKLLHKKLKKAKKSTDLVIYKDAEHSLLRNEYRVDLLDQLGDFLDEHTAAAQAAAVD